MSNAYEQLVSALRAITARTGDPLPVIAFALEVIEQERQSRPGLARRAIPRPRAPGARAIDADPLGRP